MITQEQIQQAADEKYPIDRDYFNRGGAVDGFKRGAQWMQGQYQQALDSSPRWISVDYEKLWEWANDPERKRPIVMYVDYKWDKDQTEPFRDICHLRNVKHGYGARGIGYSTYEIFLPEHPDEAKKRFIDECKVSNVEWLYEPKTKTYEK